jgi:hypothetical protein
MTLRRVIARESDAWTRIAHSHNRLALKPPPSRPKPGATKAAPSFAPPSRRTRLTPISSYLRAIRSTPCSTPRLACMYGQEW